MEGCNDQDNGLANLRNLPVVEAHGGGSLDGLHLQCSAVQFLSWDGGPHLPDHLVDAESHGEVPHYTGPDDLHHPHVNFRNNQQHHQHPKLDTRISVRP